MTRFSRKNPCPVCGGGDDMPRGQGERCHGYLSDDGRYAHCSRVPCGEQEANGTWAHRLDGECRCGTVHGEQHGSVEHGSSGNSGRVLSTIYDYEDEQGKLLFQVLRYAPKGFKQRRPHNSGWLNHLSCDGKSPCTKYKSPPHQPLPPARRVLYRLPKLLADPSAPVLIPEGEKDCDRLSELGYLATCNPRGAKKWRAEYSESLRGREVVIIPDADTLGRQHAREVASSLQGIASWVSVLELPNAKDASEFFDKGGTTEQLDQLLSETVEWNEAASAPEAQALAPQTPPEVREPTATNEEMPAATSTATGRLVLSAAEFLAERDEAVASLWGDGFYIAGGGYLIMSGEGGVGKTIIFLALHFALAAGLKEFLGFPLLGEPLPILILEAEGSRQKFRPRARSIAESYGLDLAKLPVFFHSRDANLSIDQLGGMMKACGARAVLMDPIGRFHDADLARGAGPGPQGGSYVSRARLRVSRGLLAEGEEGRRSSMTDEPSFTVGVSLTEREGGALRSICQWLEEDPSRIGRLYLEQLPEKAAEQEREYAERMQVVAVVACRKLAQAIEKRFGQAALGPSRLTENGADRR